MTQPKLFELSIAYKKITKKPLTENGKKTFLNALSNLYKALTNFLLQERILEDSVEKDLLLMDILHKKGQFNEVNQIIKLRTAKIDHAKIANIWHPLQRMQLTHFAYFNHNYEEKIDNHSSQFLHLMTNLDAFYTSFKLFYSCEMMNRMHIIPENYEISLLLEVQAQLKPRVETTYPLVTFYAHCLALSQQRTAETCISLQAYLKTKTTILSKSDQLMAYILVANFMILQIREGKEKYRAQLFDWYKTGFEAEVFIFAGTLDNLLFNNVVQNACHQKAFDWANHFIDQYSPLLTTANRDNLVRLCKANLYFAQAEYEKTIDALNKVTFTNVTYALRANGLLLRAYFELKENKKLILDFCRNFKAFLKNDQPFGKATLANYHTLIKYIRLLLRERGQLSQQELKQELALEDGQLFKPWLLKHITKYKA